MLLNVLIYAALLPFAVAAGATLVCRRFRVTPRLAWAAGVGLGFLAAQLGLTIRADGWQALASLLRPHEAVNWLPHAILLAIGIAILSAHAPRKRRPVTVFLAGTLNIGLPLRFLAGSAFVTQRWSTIEKLSYVALLAATLALTWLVLATARDLQQPRLRPLLMILVTVGAAIVITLSGVFVYGQLCGALAASLTGTMLASSLNIKGRIGSRSWQSPTWIDRLHGSTGAAGIVSVALGSLIVLGCFYGNLTPANAALLFLSLIMAGGRLPAFVSKWKPWQQAACRAALSLVPLAIVLARSLAAAQSGISASPYAI